MSRILEASLEEGQIEDVKDGGSQDAGDGQEHDVFDGMSDEEFMQYDPSGSSKKEEENQAPAGEPKEEGDQPDDAGAPGAGADGGEEGEEGKDPLPTEGEDQGEGEPAAADNAAPDAPQDFETLYKKLMAPFKANGRMIEPKSPEELIRLAQMGANYTRKMQGLQPNLKLMRMLENNGLLDEAKINFLIDVEKKNPKAIQKLLRDGKIDPMEIDTEVEPDYTPGNHSVSDTEIQFLDTLKEVSSTEAGKKAVYHINQHWDQASKEALYREPALLHHLTEHRSNGIAELIESEIERERMLGNLTNVPFIEAYRQVGDRLQNEGRLASLVQPQRAPAAENQDKQERVALETRPAAARNKPDPNGDKARAAAPSRRTPAKPQVTFDPFELSDEEIMSMAPPR